MPLCDAPLQGVPTGAQESVTVSPSLSLIKVRPGCATWHAGAAAAQHTGAAAAGLCATLLVSSAMHIAR